MHNVVTRDTKNTRGFTLIELLVVIAIIGILSSVVLASLNAARSKARDAARRSDLKQLSLALELYRDKYGAYPLSAVATCRADGWCLDNLGYTPWIPGLDEFMPVLPKSPTPYGNPGWPYHYRSNGSGYTILAGMENAQGTCGAGVTFYWYSSGTSLSNACTTWAGNVYSQTVGP